MIQLTQPQYIKDLFRQYQMKPKDYLGQNFLIDEIVLQDIINAAALKKTDTVLEVGPGLGVLTSQLAPGAGKVIAVEKDKRFTEILKINLAEFNNIELINEDILRFNISEKFQGPYKLVANIPYYLTSKLISTLLTQVNKPKLIVMLIQKEVGERMAASAGEHSLLSLSVQFYADPEIVSQVPKTSFWPSPEVDSVIIRITPKRKYPEVDDEKLFFRILKWGFAGKRKQLGNTLAAGLKIGKEETAAILNQARISPDSRPQALTMHQWISLYKKIKGL